MTGKENSQSILCRRNRNSLELPKIRAIGLGARGSNSETPEGRRSQALQEPDTAIRKAKTRVPPSFTRAARGILFLGLSARSSVTGPPGAQCSRREGTPRWDPPLHSWGRCWWGQGFAFSFVIAPIVFAACPSIVFKCTLNGSPL